MHHAYIHMFCALYMKFFVTCMNLSNLGSIHSHLYTLNIFTTPFSLDKEGSTAHGPRGIGTEVKLTGGWSQHEQSL